MKLRGCIGNEAVFRFLVRHISFKEPELYGAVVRHCAD
jgi:hypothetical protein